MRVSYSMLSAWERKDYDSAIGMWLGVSSPKNEAMIAGTTFHEDWEDEVKRTGKLPSVFGVKYLNNPETEVKIVKKLSDWLTLSGVIDLRDVPDMYEYKTGRTPASTYANGYQHKVYQVLDPRLTTAHIYAYNQHTNTVSYEKVHLDKDSLVDGINWIVTLASEMRATLESMGYDTSSHERRK